tara:strand:+ start:146 stop:1885 length:1740 start_codon:yes stop_codon:yes gene_type:complete
MAEKIDVGITIKGVDKGVADLNKLADFAETLGAALSGADKDVGILEGGLNRMTNGAYSGFKKGAAGIKAFIVGLKATKTAIIATGIGALVVAFGLLVVYWDDIKEAVTGVNEEQKLLLKYAEGTRDAAQDQLSQTKQTESTLRLAGKSERDILNLKIQQSNEVVQATKDILFQQKELKKTQIESAARNQKITAGVLAFLTLPLTMLFGAVDALTHGLSKLGVLEEGTSMVEDAAMWTASFIFDPETVEEEGDATIAEIEDQLEKMKNSRDAFILQQQSADAAADKAAKDARDKAAADTATSEQEAIDTAKAIADAKTAAQIELEDELYALSLSAYERAELALQQKFDERVAIAGTNDQLLKDAEQRLIDDLAALQQNADDNKAAAQKATDDRLAADKQKADDKIVAREEATAQAVRAARLGIVAAGFDALKSMAKTEKQQKKLAIAQILVNQGIALSSAIAGAQASATATGPGAVFTAPGFTASMIALVLGSFAQIKGIMNQAGAATEGLDTTMPSMGGGGGASSGVGGTGNQLALTPDLSAAFGGGASGIPPIQAYVLQNNISDAGALQQELQNQSSL